MKKVFGFCLVTFFCFAGYEQSNSQPQSNAVDKLMVEKLKSSQKLLEGIAIADFNKIGASAEKLLQLSNTEEWLVFKTPQYELRSNEFRRAAESLIQKAKNKNLDGSTLAFFEMTMSCVRCHQYVREVRDARLSTPPDYVAVLSAGHNGLHERR